MPKRKARKSLFSVLSLKLKTNGMKGCVLRGKGWPFQEVRIPKNVAAYYEEKDGYFRSQDTEERRYFRPRDDASRHAARRSMRKGILLSEMQKALLGGLSVCKLMR